MGRIASRISLWPYTTQGPGWGPEPLAAPLRCPWRDCGAVIRNLLTPSPSKADAQRSAPLHRTLPAASSPWDAPVLSSSINSSAFRNKAHLLLCSFLFFSFLKLHVLSDARTDTHTDVDLYTRMLRHTLAHVHTPKHWPKTRRYVNMHEHKYSGV